MSNAIGSWQWRDEIYRSNIVLLCCVPADIPIRVRAAVSESTLVEALLGPQGYDDIQDGIAARMVGCRRDGFTVAALWLNPTATAAVAAHEAFHAAHYVLGNRGLTLTDASEEAYAYFIEWLMRGIEACLDGSTPPAAPLA